MRRSPESETLEQTRAFWNASPCGAQDTFRQRFEHRYAIEPWVMDVLRLAATGHAKVLEIGCGQGTDGIVLCSLLPANATYLGIDYSEASVSSANLARQEATTSVVLKTEPRFCVGNAEHLDVPDRSVSCVYSNGVLHHTANTRRAFAEVWRVLEPGGEALITLYRKPSLKVGVAKALRGLQSAVDAMLGRDRCFYQLIKGRSVPPLLGTMLLEGFGVPVMEWYTRADIIDISSSFTVLRLTPVGCNIARRNPRSRGWSGWGYMWFVHLQKPRS